MKDLVTTMVEEMKELRKTNERVVTTLDKMNRIEKEMDVLRKSSDEMREQLKQHAEVIRHQQTFMDKMDQKERGCNLIVFGMKEEDEAETNTDKGETRSIIDNVDATASPDIKSINDSEQRKQARISRHWLLYHQWRDAHPAVKVEWKTLFSVNEAEKNKPENADRNITIDMRKRQVLCDGQLFPKITFVSCYIAPSDTPSHSFTPLSEIQERRANWIATWKKMHIASNNIEIDYTKHKEKKLYLVFVDFSKAYNPVP
ncbi:hypothetical protein CAPTEDRAFT_197893 [Capitella teleta]|uniref:Uncharacterized protein n=1 Tax=Capitella teleta TaxID=283909 RepID=R7UE09_CAPTE|nr:hypothetical protein CAPTEDRAFT_197893 [Capitella teleta]|eukprot:ELU01482.1 hypothetical protein CAPTEDRAFT_197893 [Capitella teleta]